MSLHTWKFTYICALYMHTFVFIYIIHLWFCILTSMGCRKRRGTSSEPDCPSLFRSVWSWAPLQQWGGSSDWNTVFQFCEIVNIYFWLSCTSDLSAWEYLGDTCLLATLCSLIKLISVGLFCVLYGKHGISKWFILFIFKERTKRKLYSAEAL